MKKVLTMVVVIAMAVISTNVNAQSGVKFGIKGGVNFANMSTTVNDKLVEDDREFLIGYNAGLTAEIDFHENFGFETGLVFNTKGLQYVVEEGITNTKVTTSRNLHYLDIPVLAKGMYNLTDGVQVFGKFGPYVGVGLTGKNKVHTVNDALKIDKTVDTDVKWGDGLTQTKRLDYGLQTALGVEVGGFLIEGFYKFSLGDIDNAENTSTKHHVLGLSLGYNLGF